MKVSCAFSSEPASDRGGALSSSPHTSFHQDQTARCLTSLNGTYERGLDRLDCLSHLMYRNVFVLVKAGGTDAQDASIWVAGFYRL